MFFIALWWMGKDTFLVLFLWIIVQLFGNNLCVNGKTVIYLFRQRPQRMSTANFYEKSVSETFSRSLTFFHGDNFYERSQRTPTKWWNFWFPPPCSDKSPPFMNSGKLRKTHLKSRLSHNFHWNIMLNKLNDMIKWKKVIQV